jgi:hypothetical protein
LDEKINQQRRFLMGGALATTGLSALGFGPASIAAALPASAGRSLGPLRQVRTSEPDIGYAELGSASGYLIGTPAGNKNPIGHNLPQEAPRDFALAILDVAAF